MHHFLVCDNPKCRFMLDNRMNGTTLGGPLLVLKNCPECGSNWSSTCPSCGQAIAVRFVGGVPHLACCDGKLHAKAGAAAAAA